MSCILIFHQGFTDIFNCLGLIDYYKNKYDTIYLFMRIEMKEFIDYYARNMPSIHVIYEQYNAIQIQPYLLYMKYKSLFDTSIFSFHGVQDAMRRDQYRGSFLKHPDYFFTESFYQSYDIDPMIRIKNFHIDRIPKKEKEYFDKFSKEKYIVRHHTAEHNIPVDTNLPIVDLDRTTNLFVDALKLLEGSKEMFLMDSSWAAFIYLCDVKYRWFKNIPIHINRRKQYGYGPMFTQVQLDNWIID